jgi:RimJ/RimL family protein N-acetyltransferase
VVEVGWSISPESWGEGLATEAGRASLDWAFGPAELDRVVSYTLRDNLASRRVMEKLGLAYVRDFQRRGFDQVLYEARRPAR